MFQRVYSFAQINTEMITQTTQFIDYISVDYLTYWSVD